MSDLHEYPGAVQILYSILGRRATTVVVYVALGFAAVVALPTALDAVDSLVQRFTDTPVAWNNLLISVVVLLLYMALLVATVFGVGYALFRALGVAVNQLRRKQVQDVLDDTVSLLQDAISRGVPCEDILTRAMRLNRRTGRSRI